MKAPWHADDDLLTRYVHGTVGPLDGVSLEQHLTGCADCRVRIATHVDVAPLELVWTRVREQVQAPAPSLVERLLTRFGVSEPDARIVAVAPSLRTSWLLGLAVTLGFVGLGTANGGTRGLTFFLLVAPLVPVAGVAFAYGPDVDPSYEVSVAVPYSAARLLLLRTAAVLATSLPLVLMAALLVPGLSWTAVSWLLPALAFTAVILAVSTWTRPTFAGVGLGIAWACVVGTAALDRDPYAVLAPTPLLVYAATGIAAALVLRLRIRRLTPLGSLS
ncbi:MAG: zf-HC2 domain-containing protein [Actinomycetota bacterium]